MAMNKLIKFQKLNADIENGKIITLAMQKLINQVATNTLTPELI